MKQYLVNEEDLRNAGILAFDGQFPVIIGKRQDVYLKNKYYDVHCTFTDQGIDVWVDGEVYHLNTK